MKPISGFLFWLLFIGHITTSHAHPYRAEEVETGFEGRIMAYLELIMETEDITGLSVGFVDHDGFSWAAGLGHADAENQVRASQYTIYPVASLTKMITAIAVMQLVDAGLVSLQDPIARHLEDFEIRSRFDDEDSIRIVHLLGHYAGVPRDIYKGLMTSESDLRPGLLDHLSEQYLAFSPEVKYLYSNIGYELLGKMVEEVTGQGFPAYANAHILEPLGMSNSGFGREYTQKDNFSKAYVPFFDEAYHEFPSTLEASGGLYSNTRDMTELLRWILARGETEPVLPEDLAGQMFADQKTSKSLDIGLLSGWSWVMEEHPEPMKGIYAYQIGSTLHYNAVMAVAPCHHIGVVLLANTGGVLGALEDIARLIVQAAIQKQTGESFSEEILAELPPQKEPPEDAIKQVTGKYLLQNELMTLSSMNGDLIVNTSGQNFQAFYHEDGWFSISEELRFKTIPWDDTNVLIIDRNGRIFPAGTDIMGRYNIPEDIFSIIGHYEVDNIDPDNEEVVYEEAIVSLQDGLMQIRFVLNRHQQKVFQYDFASFNLIPVSEHEAIIGGFGMYKGETVFFEADESGRYVSFAGLRFRKSGE